VQTALRNAIEPVFERDFSPNSYGFRPQRSTKDALRQVDHLLGQGYTMVVDADIKSYYDTIPQQPLLERVSQKISDGRVLDLVEAMLKQNVMDGLKEWTPEEGTPQGAVMSPVLSNIFLDELDHEMEALDFRMIRYADDFVILCRSEAEAKEALNRVQQWMSKVGLQLHPSKTRVVDATQPGGFDFLGYHFERGMKWPRQKSLEKLKRSIRSKTKRSNGHSLSIIISDVNVTLQGWFQYFKHSHRTTFEPIDGWIRMRLRSILRKRRGGRGRGRGKDHQRWPNSYFAAHGLFSLTSARAAVGRSSMR
jgi:RNA-directed DNA polymerase